MLNIYARCDQKCRSEYCDDYGVDYCDTTHNDAEDHEDDDFCARQALLSGGCEICQEYWAIWRELQDGETPKRVCHECQYLFELNSANPYGDVLYDEGAGAVYFECDGCTIPEDGDGDLEDYNDRMAERFPNGEDPMMKHLFFVQCQKCDVDFEIEAGQQAWCPSCHADKLHSSRPGQDNKLSSLDKQRTGERIPCGTRGNPHLSKG